MKESFVFYKDWYTAIKDLDSSVQLEVYDAIMRKVFDDRDITLSALAKVAVGFIFPQIERDNAKYERIIKRRSEAGKKHRGNQYTNGTNGTSVPSLEQNGTNGTNGTVNVNDNDNVNVNVNDNVLSKDNNSTFLTEGTSDSDAVRTSPKTYREKVIMYFNDKMRGKSIKPIKNIVENTQRAEWLKARRREHGDNAILLMIDKASASQFLNGYNSKGFVASFDWLIRPNNFLKVLEGNYDDRTERKDNRGMAPGQIHISSNKENEEAGINDENFFNS